MKSDNHFDLPQLLLDAYAALRHTLPRPATFVGRLTSSREVATSTAAPGPYCETCGDKPEEDARFCAPCWNALQED